MSLIIEEDLDARHQKSIKSLFPPFQEPVYKFFEKCHKSGLYVYCFYGLRDWAEQAGLYDQGRLTPGKIVTNCQPGYSLHNYGLAIDVVFDANLFKKGIQWSWECKSIPTAWKQIGMIGKDLSMEWAGDWKHFKELCHFQKTYGFTINQLYELCIRDLSLELDINKFYNKLSKLIKK